MPSCEARLSKQSSGMPFARNPASLVTLPKMIRRELTILPPAEAARFVEAAKEDEWSALWLVLLFGGLRPGEAAAALKWTDLEGTNLRIQRALVFGYRGGSEIREPKTSRSRRTVPLPEVVLKSLRDHKRQQAEARLRLGSIYEDQGLIFAGPTGGPINVSSLRKWHFQKILNRAKLSHLRTYDLRHTCASLMLAAGTNAKVVSERLGHASIVLTMDTYSAVLPTLQEEATAKLEHLIMG